MSHQGTSEKIKDESKKRKQASKQVHVLVIFFKAVKVWDANFDFVFLISSTFQFRLDLNYILTFCSSFLNCLFKIFIFVDIYSFLLLGCLPQLKLKLFGSLLVLPSNLISWFWPMFTLDWYYLSTCCLSRGELLRLQEMTFRASWGLESNTHQHMLDSNVLMKEVWVSHLNSV